MLCYARIILIPVFLFYFTMGMNHVAALIFIILSLTDMFDGYLARRFGQVTTTGKFLDPLADKLLVISALVYLNAAGKAAAWMVLLIIAREITVTGLRAIGSAKSKIISASHLGKLKTVTQIIAVCWLIFGLDFGYWILLIATLMSVFSGLHYLYKNRRLFD